MIMGFWIGVFSTLVVPLFASLIGIILLLAMWMADDTEPDLQKYGSILFLAFISLSIAWPNYMAVAIPGLPWITPTRLVLVLASSVLLLQVSQSAVTRKLIRGAINCSRPAYIGLIIFILAMFGTFWLARAPGEALTFVVQQLILWLVPLLIGLWLFNDARIVTKSIIAIIISLLPVMILTLFEYKNQLPIWIPYIPSFLQVEGPQMQTFLEAQTLLDGSYRAKGNFGVPLYFTQILLMVLPFIMHGIFDARSPRERMLSVLYLIFILSIILLNNTRTGSTGQLVVIGGMIGIFALRHYLQSRNPFDMTGPVLTVGVPLMGGILALLIALSPRLQTMTIGGSLHAGSDEVRDEQWAKAWAAVLSNPFGHGAQESGPLTGRLRLGVWIVDSTWINFLVDYGIIGALGWAFFLGFVAAAGVLIYLQRHDRSADLCGPAAIAIGAFMMSMYTISYYANIPLVMVFVALVCATRYRLATIGNLTSCVQVFRRTEIVKEPIQTITTRA
jgi:hypothetical protein